MKKYPFYGSLGVMVGTKPLDTLKGRSNGIAQMILDIKALVFYWCQC